jgi:hypothetical protein
VIEKQSLRPLTLLLIGALGEGRLYIAEAPDPTGARSDVGTLITRTRSAFRAGPTAKETRPTGR